MVFLPPPDTKRWVARRKAAVLNALASGEITLQEACARYWLSEEELRAWQRAFDAEGLPGTQDEPALGLGDRVSLFGPTPGGLGLLSDVTTSPAAGLRPASVRRLVAALVREARRTGEEVAFE